MYGCKGVCAPDLMGDQPLPFGVRCTPMLHSDMLEFAGFCSQNPNSEHDAWLFNYTD